MAMFARSNRRRVPVLNTTSTADISFMLLIFFLVTTSIDTDRGLSRLLPPPPKSEQLQDTKVKQRNVLNVRIDADNHLLCNGQPVTADALQRRVMEFVENAGNQESLPEKHTVDIPLLGRCVTTSKHVISVQTDRQSSYEAYFKMQNTLVAAYAQLRNDLALQRFGRPYKKCSPEQREAIGRYYPMRISEAEPTEATEKGGGA